MATIKNITGSLAGFGQISHDPHNYFAGFGGATALALISTKGPDLTIETDKFVVKVYDVLGKYALQATLGTAPYVTISLDKMYRNTASAECLVAACESRIKLMGYESTRQCKTRLEERRRAEGYTQKQLAEITGIHVNVISRLERGEQDVLKCEFGTVVKLARALECRPEDLA